MTILLWLFVVFSILGFAWQVAFTQTTLALGRELSDTNSKTGFQNAVTPPWSTLIGIVIYAIGFATIAAIWWYEGWLYGVGTLVFIFILSMALSTQLAKYSTYFRLLIIRSMSNRYADFVRDGDHTRAQAMQHLLLKVSYRR